MGDLERKPLSPALVGHRHLAHSGIHTRKGRDVETVGPMPKGVSTMSTSKFKAPWQDDSTSVAYLPAGGLQNLRHPFHLLFPLQKYPLGSEHLKIPITARPPGQQHSRGLGAQQRPWRASRTPSLHQVVYLHIPGLSSPLRGPPQGSLKGRGQVGEG